MTQPEQLALDFAEWRPENMKRANQDAILRAIHEHYPPTDYERRIMAQGISPDRFVHLSECEDCNFSRQDHTVGGTYQTKVCLKDLATKGLWKPEKEW